MSLTNGVRFIVIITVLVLAVSGAGGQVRSFKPIADRDQLNPDPNNWLNFRRTLDGQGYSPLKQITKQNAQQLTLVWSWSMHPGRSEASPMVANGMMFVPNPGGGVQALDAATGDLVWDFRTPRNTTRVPFAAFADKVPERGDAPSTDTVRNLALYGDKVYTVSGTRLIALNAHTGAVVWDQQINDPKQGFEHTAGPIAVKGRIVIGTNGCERYKKDGCDIVAVNAETGKELWRTNTIAQPGQPGGDTWGDLPAVFRAGGDNWQAGSYDPATNLIYYGTAQAKPWARFQRGTDGDALYTNSTLALDPDTGKIVWYYQYIPAETHDQDETFERLLIDYNGRSSIFSMGKTGILWELDRRTGAFRAAHDLGYQTLFKVDPNTGKITYRPEVIPQTGTPVSWCPGTNGFKNWTAMAYHPETQAVYVPLWILSCVTATFGPKPEQIEGGGGGGGAFRRSYTFHPESPDGLGEFLAMDIKTGRVLWRHRTRMPMSTAALTTGGGLAVVGDQDRYVYIHDVSTGRILSQLRLPTSPRGFPITYAIGGRQYLAIPVGGGSGEGPAAVDPRDEYVGMPRGGSDFDLVPEHRGKAASAMNGIFVFALPQTGR